MTNEEAKAIIRKEYLCVDRDCDIERSCGKCDLMMPSKEPILEAYKMALKALEQRPCEDAISRQAVIDSLHSKFADGFDSDRWWNSKSVLYAINKVPPVNPTKTGHWIWCVGSHKCSNCEKYTCFSHKELLKYCPNCGARMVKPQERRGIKE